MITARGKNYIKRKQMKILKLKHSITKIKNSLLGLNNTLEVAEGTISKVENRSKEIIQSDRQQKIKIVSRRTVVHQ